MAAERILIVDDDEDVLLIVQTILDNAGYSAVLARNGREGVEKAIEGHPDLILLDVMMPELSGWEVCTTLKSAPETRHIPIAMLTVKSEIRDLITGMQVGADDYITKPFTRKKLLSTVQAPPRREAALGPDVSRLRKRGGPLPEPPLRLGDGAADGARDHRRAAGPPARQPRDGRALHRRRAVQPHRGRVRLGGLRRPAQAHGAHSAAHGRDGLCDRRLRRGEPGGRLRLLRVRDARAGRGRRGPPAEEGAPGGGVAPGLSRRDVRRAHPQAHRRLRRARSPASESPDARRAPGLPGAPPGDRGRDHQGRGAAGAPPRKLSRHPAQAADPERLPADLPARAAGPLRARGAHARPGGHRFREPRAAVSVRRPRTRRSGSSSSSASRRPRRAIPRTAAGCSSSTSKPRRSRPSPAAAPRPCPRFSPRSIRSSSR